MVDSPGVCLVFPTIMMDSSSFLGLKCPGREDKFHSHLRNDGGREAGSKEVF